MRTCRVDWLDAHFDAIGVLLDWLDQWRAVTPAPSSDLDAEVRKVVDVSWQGDAADAFSRQWIKDKKALDALPGMVGGISSILEELYRRLENAQHDAEWAADRARQAGAVIDYSGVPQALRELQQNPGTPLDPAVIRYLESLKTCQDEIAVARMGACRELAAMHSDLTGGSDFDVNTAVAWIGIGVSAHTSPKDVIPAYERGIGKLARTWVDDLAALDPKNPATGKALAQAARELGATDGKIPAMTVRASEIPGISWLTRELGDIIKPIGESHIGAIRAAGKIPVLGWGLAGVAAYFDAQEYMKEGCSPAEAYLKAGIQEGGALVVGGLAAGAAGAAVVAVCGVGAPVIVVGGAAVLAGAIVGDGVGHWINDAFHEDWDADAKGTFAGIGRLGGLVNVTGKALGETWNDVAGAPGAAWDAITSFHF